MVVRTMLVQEQENGSLIVMVQHTYLLGESPGFRYDYLFVEINIKLELNTQNNLYFKLKYNHISFTIWFQVFTMHDDFLLIINTSIQCPVNCRYLVCLNELEATQCLRNFGFFLHFFPCIQVYTLVFFKSLLHVEPF